MFYLHNLYVPMQWKQIKNIKIFRKILKYDRDVPRFLVGELSEFDTTNFHIKSFGNQSC